MNSGSMTADIARCEKAGSNSNPIVRGLAAIRTSDRLRRVPGALGQVHYSHPPTLRSRRDHKRPSMIIDKPLDWAPIAPERARTLPARYFYDDGVFRAEREHIFYPAWHCVAHV